MGLSPEVDALRVAVQKFAAEVGDDETMMVTQAVVLWETVSFDEDGEAQRQISYAIPTDNFALSGALGLIEAGKHFIRRDVLGEDYA